jgi:hypothetical protein
MGPKHIYNSEGRWLAFIVDGDIFNRSGDLIARVVNHCEIYGLDGSLMGTIAEDGHSQSLQATLHSIVDLEPFGV